MCGAQMTPLGSTWNQPLTGMKRNRYRAVADQPAPIPCGRDRIPDRYDGQFYERRLRGSRLGRAAAPLHG